MDKCIAKDNYRIELKGWYGDFIDCVAVFRITNPNGKVTEDNRVGKASKKGIMRTSIYGMKVKVDLENETLEFA